MSRIILFDLDNTLLRSSVIKDDIAFPEAIKKVYGADVSLDMINPHGMTDQKIISELAKKGGVDPGEIGDRIDECMEEMAELYNNHEDDVELVEGVEKSLEHLEKQGFELGLVTGNIKEIAHGKVKQAGISDFFGFGGYGDDAVERDQILEKALRRAKEIHGEIEEVFLVGDSPQDIRAGKKVGVKTVGIAQGVYPEERLEEEAADFVIKGWSDLENLKSIFLGEDGER